VKIAVLIDTIHLYPPVDRTVKTIAKSFADIGHETYIINGGVQLRDERISGTPYRVVHIYSSKNPILGRIKYVRYLWNQIKSGELDAIFMYGVSLPFAFIIGTARRHAVKLLYFQADQYEATPVMALKVRVKIAIINFIDRYLARRSDLIILGGTSELKQHFQRIAPGVKILRRWVPTVVDVFATGDGLAFRKKNQMGDLKIICYTGALCTIHGIDVLIRAMKHVVEHRKDIRLVLAGQLFDKDPFSNDPLDYIGLTKSLGLEDYVLFTGILDVSNVRDLLNASDVLVMPRIDHKMNRVAAPVKLTEYLSSANPVVATRVGVVEQYLQDGKDALLCKPGDVKDLADKIIRILDDPLLGKQIGENGAQVARNVMDYRIWVRDVSQALNSSN